VLCISGSVIRGALLNAISVSSRGCEAFSRGDPALIADFKLDCRVAKIAPRNDSKILEYIAEPLNTIPTPSTPRPKPGVLNDYSMYNLFAAQKERFPPQLMDRAALKSPAQKQGQKFDSVD